MRAPGARNYKELCEAAKSEERHQQELSKRQMYQRDELTKSSSSNTQKSSDSRIFAINS